MGFLAIRSFSSNCRNTENQKKKKKKKHYIVFLTREVGRRQKIQKTKKLYIVLATVKSRNDKTPRKKRQHDPNQYRHKTTITIIVLIGSSNQCIPGLLTLERY